MPAISKRGEELPESAIRKLVPYAEKAKSMGRKVYHLNIGQPDIKTPQHAIERIRNFNFDLIPYGHSFGNETYRNKLAQYYRDRNLEVDASQILITTGGSEAISFAFMVCFNPGEEVIILAPFFVEYKFYIDNHGGVPVEAWTNHETFQLDIDSIKNAITHKTRAILICSPNNPTGVIYPEESLRQLGAVLMKIHKDNGHLIYVISDEPYARIAFDGRHVPNIFPLVESSIIVTSHSKDLALPGERIGYLSANPRMDTAMQFMEGAVFSNRVLGFVNAPALMQRLVAKLQDESVDIAEYQAKRDLLVSELTGMGFSMVKPDGAFYLFPRSPITDDVAFVKLAQKHHILLVPGAGFGAPGFFRIAYCVDKGIIERSLPAWRTLAKEVGLKG